MPAKRKSEASTFPSSKKRKVASRRKTGTRTTAITKKAPLSSISNYHKMLRDPFNENTRAVGLPDSYAGQTLCVKFQSSFTVNTDEFGAAAVRMQPNLAAYLERASSITNGVVDSWAANEDHPQLAAYSSAINRKRIISFSARAYYFGQNDLRSGLMHALVSVGNPVTEALPIDQWANDHGHHSVSIPVTNKALTVTSKLYTNPEFSGVNDPQGGSLNSIYFGFTGLPASKSNIRVDTVHYVEIIPKLDSALSAHTRPSPTSAEFVPTGGPTINVQDAM